MSNNLARISPAAIRQADPVAILNRYVPPDQHEYCLPIVQQAINQGDAKALIEIVEAFRGAMRRIEANSDRLDACEAWAQKVDSQLATLAADVSSLKSQHLPQAVTNHTSIYIDLSDRRDQSDRSTSHTETNSFGAIGPIMAGLAIVALVMAIASNVSVETYHIRPTGYEVIPTQ